LKDPIFKRLLELHPKFSDLSLGRIKRLLKDINFDEKKLPPIIHIGGTNGKGSTASILKSILNEHGYSTHVYTTPHLINFNERIQLNSKNISNLKLLKYLSLCEKINDGKLITFFEITTAAAFKAFQDHYADFLILEVGLGGRFDATNIINNKKYAAITPISLDHQDYLGNSLTKIAFEKLGIFHKRSINFINKQKPGVMKYIRSELGKRKITASIYNKDWLIKSNFYISDKIKINLTNLNLIGAHQKSNAGLAIHISRSLLKNDFKIDIVEKAINKCQWAGRLQYISDGKLLRYINRYKNIYLDGFHNIDGMKVFTKSLEQNRKILICSFLNNKKYTYMLNQLSKYFSKIIVVKMNEENSILEEDIPKNLSVLFSSSLKESFSLINKYSSSKTSIYFGGSLYFIGEVLKMNKSK
jgi:dihydrofolate synthase/folylpolyglutamate synthase